MLIAVAVAFSASLVDRCAFLVSQVFDLVERHDYRYRYGHDTHVHQGCLLFVHHFVSRLCMCVVAVAAGVTARAAACVHGCAKRWGHTSVSSWGTSDCMAWCLACIGGGVFLFLYLFVFPLFMCGCRNVYVAI